MADSNPDSKAILTERDVIIIAIVCAVIIVTLLIVLICFICRRRQANAKEYAEETASQPQPANGTVASKKPPVQTQTLPQVYNNIDGPADGLRNRQDAFSSSMGLRGAGRDKYIDLEERQDPSLQSQESGYSTADMGKPKKVIYEVVV